MERLVDLAKQLVAIPSDRERDHEVEIIGFLIDLLQEKGLRCEKIPTSLGNERVDIIAFAPCFDDFFNKSGTGSIIRDGLLLAGHLDVVPPGDPNNWTRDPYTPWIGDDDPDKLHGRGTSDMKGALAAMIDAYTRFVEIIEKQGSSQATLALNRPVALLFTVDEEFSLQGADAFVKSPWADFFGKAVLGEPTGMFPVRGHKGVMFSRVRVKGKAAHGSVPFQGINAIEIAMDLYRVIRQGFEKDVLDHDHPVLGKPTLNLGRFQGGTAPNIVPDSCVFDLDRRVTGGEEISRIKEQLEKTCQEFEIPKGANVEIEMFNGRPPFFLEDGNPLLEYFSNKIGPPNVMNGYTEAGIYFNKGGISTIIIGPGSINQAHVEDEHVSIKELLLARDVYLQAMLDHARGII